MEFILDKKTHFASVANLLAAQSTVVTVVSASPFEPCILGMYTVYTDSSQFRQLQPLLDYVAPVNITKAFMCPEEEYPGTAIYPKLIVKEGLGGGLGSSPGLNSTSINLPSRASVYWNLA